MTQELQFKMASSYPSYTHIKIFFFFPRDSYKEKLLCKEELTSAHWYLTVFQDLPWLIKSKEVSDKKIRSLVYKQSLKCCSICAEYTAKIL